VEPTPDATDEQSADSRRHATGVRMENTPAGQKPVYYKVTVAPELDIKLTERAKELGISVQALMISSALSENIETRQDRRGIAKILFDLFRLISNMANNLNQVAKLANSTHEVSEENWAVLRGIDGFLRRIAGRLDAALDAFDAT
jgi:hypothetical protein